MNYKLRIKNLNYQLSIVNYQLFCLVMLFAITLTSSCKKDEVDPYAEGWKLQNEKAFNDLAYHPDYTELHLPGGTGSVYYRVLQQGTGKGIVYTSRAEVYYKGWFVVTHANEDLNIKAGTVFDKKLFDDGIPLKVALCTSSIDANRSYISVVEGWKIALQYMVEGDKWEVWIPYRLAYGEEGYNAIPGHTTLAFEIEVVKAVDLDDFPKEITSDSGYYY